MMEIIAFAAISYLAVHLLVSLVNLITGPYLTQHKATGTMKVSVLVPARNEEGNIGRLLDNFAGSSYRNCEILVYDDESADSTAQIIRGKSISDSRIRYVKGEKLPDGWLGKNHAYYQLAMKSEGDCLLFLDADIGVCSSLINDSVALMEKEKPGLLSLFPVQEMKSPGEWLTVPLMNRILQ